MLNQLISIEQDKEGYLDIIVLTAKEGRNV